MPNILARLRPDLAPIKNSREFRLLYTGEAAGSAGVTICYVALPYQAYQLSHSSLVVGLLSCAELLPVLLAGMLGGALADAIAAESRQIPKRRLDTTADSRMPATTPTPATAATVHQRRSRAPVTGRTILPPACRPIAFAQAPHSWNKRRTCLGRCRFPRNPHRIMDKNKKPAICVFCGSAFGYEPRFVEAARASGARFVFDARAGSCTPLAPPRGGPGENRGGRVLVTKKKDVKRRWI